MEGYQGLAPAPLIPRVWAPGWNSVQSLNKFQSEIGGPLKSGDPGRRLIEPDASDPGRRFAMPAPRDTLEADAFLLLPLPQIFGSDVLSMGAPAVAQRAPQPFLAVGPSDAPAEDGRRVRVTAPQWTLELPVRQVPGMPGRTVGIPAGLPGMPPVDRPLAVKIAVIPHKENA